LKNKVCLAAARILSRGNNKPHEGIRAAAEAGNAQCFYRFNSNNNLTVDWDHETWEVSNQMKFFEFINQRMSEIDEE